MSLSYHPFSIPLLSPLSLLAPSCLSLSSPLCPSLAPSCLSLSSPLCPSPVPLLYLSVLVLFLIYNVPLLSPLLFPSPLPSVPLLSPPSLSIYTCFIFDLQCPTPVPPSLSLSSSLYPSSVPPPLSICTCFIFVLQCNIFLYRSMSDII